MLHLRLFGKDDPSRQIDSRPLDEGEVVIGRDSKADWPIADPDRGISRRHLTVSNRGGLVTLRDTSSNGVFLGDRRERIERDRPVPVGPGEAIRFGGYVLVLEEGRREAAAPRDASRPAPFDEPDPQAPDRRAPAQPFGSTLKPDPFGGGGPVEDGDAWERRREAPAGSWEATGSHRSPDPGQLIGTDPRWAEPPPPDKPAGYGFDAPFERPILEKAAPVRATGAIPSDWMEAPRGEAPAEPAPPPAPSTPMAEAPVPPRPEPVRPEPSAGADPRPTRSAPAEPDPDLFGHFCAGAGLDPRHFAGVPLTELMERLGATYRQAVLGIADLMRERTSLRNEYRMVHTAVRPEGNNPFKWVPPQRIAVELLRDEGGGYTTGERALNDALTDVKAHLLCMLAGMRAALNETFRALQPDQVEARLGGRGYLMAVQRDAALWAEYVAMAAALRVEAEDNADGLINRAFRQGYEEQAAALGGNGRRR